MSEVKQAEGQAATNVEQVKGTYDPRADAASALYEAKYDKNSLDYLKGVHDPLSINYDPYRR